MVGSHNLRVYRLLLYSEPEVIFQSSELIPSVPSAVEPSRLCGWEQATLLKAALAVTVAAVLGTCSFVLLSYIPQKDWFYVTQSICATNFKKCSKDEDFCLKFKSLQSRIVLQQGNPQRHWLTQHQPRQGRGNPKANGRKLDLNRGWLHLVMKVCISPLVSNCDAQAGWDWSNGTVCTQHLWVSSSHQPLCSEPFTTFVHPDDTMTGTETIPSHVVPSACIPPDSTCSSYAVSNHLQRIQIHKTEVAMIRII